jgi:hypothetical protein
MYVHLPNSYKYRNLYIVMKIKQTVKKVVSATLIVVGFGFLSLPSTAYAAVVPGNNGCGTNTAIIQCKNVDVTKSGAENTGLWSLLLTAINILTAGVGVAAIGGIIYGSILYTSAGGSPEQVKKAIGIITNVVIGVVAYALMFSLLNFLIPGGLFKP